MVQSFRELGYLGSEVTGPLLIEASDS